MGKWDGKERRNSGRYDRTEQRVKDAVIFILAIGGSINEIWFVREARPYILAFILSFLGVPFILKADSLRFLRKKDEDSDSGEGE